MSRSLLAWNYILIDGIFKLEGGGGRIILLEEKEQPEKCTHKNIYIFLKWFEIVSKKKKHHLQQLFIYIMTNKEKINIKIDLP